MFGVIGPLSTALVVSVIMSTPPADQPAPTEIPTIRPEAGSEQPTTLPPPTVEVDVDDSDGSIGVGVVLPAGAGTSGSDSPRPRCTWKNGRRFP